MTDPTAPADPSDADDAAAFEAATEATITWPTHCPTCGTALQTHSVGGELDPGAESLTNAHTVSAVADFCPNPDCPRGGADAEPVG